MQDVVLPPSGGWIIVKRRLPPSVPQVPLFSIFWAKPERLFVAGTLEASWWELGVRPLSETELALLYNSRHTQRALMPSEKAMVKALDKEAEDLNGNVTALEMRVRIRAPDGEVCVEPYEWTPCGDVTPFLNEVGNDVILHEYGDTSPSRGIREQMFYLRARGIPRSECLNMLFGEVKKPGVYWLEMTPAVVKAFERQAA